MICNEFDTANTQIFCMDTLSDDKGIRSLRKFLNEMIVNFSNETFSFYDVWGEFPFIYSEKQIHSILAPSIHQYTGNVWLEQPFKDYKKNQRFLDIATTDRKNIYLIELKHSWNSKTDKTNKRLADEWEIAIKQIDDINRKTIHGYFNFKDYNVFKIALMITPTYLSSSEEHNILLSGSKEYAEMLFNDFDSYDAQKYKANFVGTIKINEPKKYVHDFYNGSQVYPYVSFIAKVLPV
ncbi:MULTISPECIES: hypothetical protein [Aliarcobacter]|uniref:hypothetical protein n=1 Tax=Aliarcobacter TaxID=2321111 RepID=UPI0021B68CD8|nr:MULTISPECIES: hypothetical protein [Aliarcobacter]MCT7519180.1 hypothetical protein [Aliarcobacter cryaerophilus]